MPTYWYLAIKIIITHYFKLKLHFGAEGSLEPKLFNDWYYK